jgi:hypothetical protein
MPRPTLLITAGGSAYLAAMIVLAVTKAMLGTPLFFLCVAVGIIVYASAGRTDLPLETDVFS